MPSLHKFHIPVMGTGFTIDTPLKVAKYGISSVISLVDDVLIEKMRKFYCEKLSIEYTPISKTDIDHRAKRITSYLNLIDELVDEQIKEMKAGTFSEDSELYKYFELLPDTEDLKKEFSKLNNCTDEEAESIKKALIDSICKGSIDVNIMTKLDKDNYSKGEKLPSMYSDALSALRGFANSTLQAGIVFSAGLNNRLYTYVENFKDFFPDNKNNLKKKIIIKVSDYRSALTQGKFLARKGLWVSEFRIESGLNCGGHAFATDGFLLGPVLEEFKTKRDELIENLYKGFSKGLLKRDPDASVPSIDELPVKITVQGGLTSSSEQRLLFDHYNVDSTGWGTPFLLSPEVTSVDDTTLERLRAAKSKDVFMSNSSPLNVIFQNLKNSPSELERKKRIEAGKSGSPCPKGYLSFNTEFTERPICTASAKFQKLKLEQIETSELSGKAREKAIENVYDKSCICHELGGGALIKNGISTEEKIKTAVCPGPSLSIFSKLVSLKDMTSHIYGRLNLTEGTSNPGMFMTELKLYIEELGNKVSRSVNEFTEKESKEITSFYNNLKSGIEYYGELAKSAFSKDENYSELMNTELDILKKSLDDLLVKNGLKESLSLA